MRGLLDAERRLGGLVLALGDAGRVELVNGVHVAPTALQVDSESETQTPLSAMYDTTG